MPRIYCFYSERNRLISVLIAAILLSILYYTCDNDKDYQIQINKHNLLGETEFHLVRDTCSIRIVRYDQGINQGILKYYNNCNFDPVKDKKALLLLLKNLFNTGCADSLHTFAWGRLSNNINNPSVFSIRLANAAYKHRDWDSDIGKSLQVHENDFVLVLLEGSNVFTELRQIFLELGYNLHVTGVEKVIVTSIDSVYHLPSDLDNVLNLPVDCQVWFSISPYLSNS